MGRSASLLFCPKCETINPVNCLGDRTCSQNNEGQPQRKSPPRIQGRLMRAFSDS